MRVSLPMLFITRLAIHKLCLEFAESHPKSFAGIGEETNWTNLQSELGPSPVPTLGVVPDLVVSSQADPLRQRPVDPLLLGQDALDLKGLVRRLGRTREKREKTKSVATPSNRAGTPSREPARGRETTSETKRAEREREKDSKLPWSSRLSLSGGRRTRFRPPRRPLR